LQEVFLPAHRRFLVAALRETYPHALAPDPTRSVLGSGLLLLSVAPIRSGGFVPMAGVGLTERGALWAELDDPVLGPLRLANVHLRAGPPRRHAAELAHLLRVAGGHAILSGDFNCGPAIAPELYRRILRDRWIDAYAAAGANEAPTWDAANPLNRVGRYRRDPSQRIDHVFIPARSLWYADTAAIVLRDGTPPLSDHYGMLARLWNETRRQKIVDAPCTSTTLVQSATQSIT
jgi:endonuclease/exonuclease/phosphatase family metal-dependent hydrolase